MKARMTSSRHGLYKLGNTYATMKIQKIESYEKTSKEKCFLSTNRPLQLEVREGGFASNRKSESCGEQVLKSCTNRPSRSGRRLALSALAG